MWWWKFLFALHGVMGAFFSLVIADWVDINYVILVYVCHLQPRDFLGPLGSCFGPLGDWVLARNAASEASVGC